MWIPLLTVVTSALVAWLTSRLTLRVEAEKTRLTTQQKVMESLIARRIQVYPELHAIVSDLPKAFDLVPTVLLDLHKTLKQLNAWDSQHSLIMSVRTSNACNAFRMAFVNAVSRNLTSKPQLDTLLELAQKVEHALRTDLGVGIDPDWILTEETDWDETRRPRTGV